MGRPPDEGAEDAARWWQAYQLAEQGRDDELRRRAAGGDQHAARHLADWLADRLRTAEAIEVIRPLADGGDEDADRLLARWLAEEDSAQRDAAERDAAERDVIKQDVVKQDALGELRRRAASGSYPALVELAGWLAGRGQLDELRELITGHRELLASWLAAQHDMKLLALAADLGDDEARQRLERWLARLRERADAGSEGARQQLADWLG